MGLDIESVVCAAAVIIIGAVFREIVYALGEPPSCIWLGWFFVVFAVLVAIFMLTNDGL